MINRNPLLILVLCFFVGTGCKKDQTIEIVKTVEKEHSWKPVLELSYSMKPQFGSYSTGNFLYFYGINTFSQLQLTSPDSGFQFRHYIKEISNFSFCQAPICNSYFLNIKPSFGLTAYSIQNPVSDGNSANFQAINSDSTFHSLIPCCYAINDSGTCLIGYNRKINEGINEKPNLFALAFRPTEDGNIRLTQTRKIVQDEGPEVFVMQGVFCYNNTFFVSFPGNTYRVTSNWTLEKVFDHTFFKMFSHENKLYGLGWDGFFESKDGGLTWSTWPTYLKDLYLFNFTKVNSSIIAYRNSQIFKIDLVNQEIIPVELDTDGLDKNAITSVSTLGNLVFATTLSGVFYRKLNGFFDPR